VPHVTIAAEEAPMKPIGTGQWAFAILFLGGAVAFAQVAPRPAQAPMAPGVTTHVETPTESDPTQPAKATDPEEPTAGHDDATGKNLKTPEIAQPDRAQVAKATTAHPEFLTLDTNNHGYLTLDDVRHNHWLSANFARCDVNHDGHLSQEEYANCR
jgi:hypothetical protein